MAEEKDYQAYQVGKPEAAAKSDYYRRLMAIHQMERDKASELYRGATDPSMYAGAQLRGEAARGYTGAARSSNPLAARQAMQGGVEGNYTGAVQATQMGSEARLGAIGTQMDTEARRAEYERGAMMDYLQRLQAYRQQENAAQASGAGVDNASNQLALQMFGASASAAGTGMASSGGGGGGGGGTGAGQGAYDFDDDVAASDKSYKQGLEDGRAQIEDATIAALRRRDVEREQESKKSLRDTLAGPQGSALRGMYEAVGAVQKPAETGGARAASTAAAADRAPPPPSRGYNRVAGALARSQPAAPVTMQRPGTEPVYTYGYDPQRREFTPDDPRGSVSFYSSVITPDDALEGGYRRPSVRSDEEARQRAEEEGREAAAQAALDAARAYYIRRPVR